MKKKKQESVAETTPNEDLKSIIHQHTLFFDKLIKLIPARFYLLVDDSEKPWFQGLNKAEKAAVKKETKENIKKSQRDRWNPDKSGVTTLDLLKQNLEKENSNESDDNQGIMKPLAPGLEEKDQSVTYEELRQRLHCKIEEFRVSRNCGNSDNLNKREDRNAKRGIQNKKRKRDDGSEESKPAPGESSEKVMKYTFEASKDLMFGQIKLDNEERQGKKKKKKLSKHKELERTKKLEEAKKDPAKGELIAKKQSWKTAMNRAAGIKVHDDPKLLQKSIQKENKRHQKNVDKWKERVETRNQMKTEKQQRRSENIAERIHQKKMRKIEKREKKLLRQPRPGFEGRKEGFINEGSG